MCVGALCNCYVITLPESAISNRFFLIFSNVFFFFFALAIFLWMIFFLATFCPLSFLFFVWALPLKFSNFISISLHWFFFVVRSHIQYHWMLRCHVSIVSHSNFYQLFSFILFLVVIRVAAAAAVTIVDNSPIMRLLARFSILCSRIKILLVYFQVVHGFACKNHVALYSIERQRVKKRINNKNDNEQ